MIRLGGQVTGFADAKMTRAGDFYEESIKDTGKMLEFYGDVIVMRHFQQGAPHEAAKWASIPVINGGAAVLGRDDIGSLAEGKCADLFAINLNRLDYAGALHDPVAASLLCAPQTVDVNIVGGKMVVEYGEPIRLNIQNLIKKHNLLADRLLNG